MQGKGCNPQCPTLLTSCHSITAFCWLLPPTSWLSMCYKDKETFLPTHLQTRVPQSWPVVVSHLPKMTLFIRMSKGNYTKPCSMLMCAKGSHRLITKRLLETSYRCSDLHLLSLLGSAHRTFHPKNLLHFARGNLICYATRYFKIDCYSYFLSFQGRRTEPTSCCESLKE